MLFGMCFAKQMQLQRNPCHHRYKANGNTDQNSLSMWTIQITILHIYSFAFLSTRRAEPFEPDLLTIDDKAFVGAFCHGQRYTRQAVSVAAARARKMRMALMLGTIVG
jgi:hypothetical protein